MANDFKHYKVGGCVRDALLGKQVSDIDYVVVGETPEAMINRGFKQVGADFPVFLHPITGEEYALARTERKSGVGYNGFTTVSTPDITLESDLSRRDFTINAMAMDDNGAIIDPYGGVNDLQASTLRHVSDAFAEDPVRVLRGARFAARYNFKIAPETLELMTTLTRSGELDHLTKERIVLEFDKCFDTGKPSTMFNILNDIGALPRVLKGLNVNNIDFNKIDRDMTNPERWAYILTSAFDSKEQALAWAKEFRLSSEAIDIATSSITLQQMNRVDVTAINILNIWNALDFKRRLQKAMSAVKVVDILNNVEPSAPFWKTITDSVLAIDEGALAKECQDKSKLKNIINAARLAKIEQYLGSQYESAPSI